MKIFSLLIMCFPLSLFGQNEVILPTLDSDQTETYSIELIECANGNWIGVHNRGLHYFNQHTDGSNSFWVLNNDQPAFKFAAPSEELAINLVDNFTGFDETGAEFQIVHQTDLNSDGLLDLIVYVSQSRELSWCERVALGKYKQPVLLHDLMSLPTTIGTDSWINFFVQKEFFIFQSRETVGMINLNAPQTDFHFKTSKKLADGVLEGIADMNNNGTSDFLLNFSSEGLAIIEHGTSPELNENEFIQTNVICEGQAYFMDVNNDHHVDVLTTDAQPIQLYYSKGNGQFDEPIASRLLKGISKRIEGLHLLDFDADGDNDSDLLLYGQYLFLLENTGKDNFSPHRIGQPPYDPHSISLADLENDGDLDIILNSHEGISLFYNERGRFKESDLLKVGGYLDIFYHVDLDQDGDKDFLYAHEWQMYWSENGSNGFQSPRIFDFLSIKP